MNFFSLIIFFALLWNSLADSDSDSEVHDTVRDISHRKRNRDILKNRHHLIKRRTKEDMPNFHSKTVDMKLENKLGQMKLGPLAGATRHRRDENEARKDVESAEIHSAVSAVHAEQAKENVLHALQDNERVEHDLDNLNINAGSNKNVTTQNKNMAVTNDEYEYYDDDENDNDDDDDDTDVAEETIIDDGVATIKTSIITTGRDDRGSRIISHKNSSSSTSTLGQLDEHRSDKSQEVRNKGDVCQGLLDLRSMSDDFRQRLKALIDQEEQVVERLERLKDSMDKTVLDLQQAEQNVRKQRTVEPSKACVYIEENVSSDERTDNSRHNAGKAVITSQQQKWSNEGMKNVNKNQNDLLDAGIHVYTSQGVLPPKPPNNTNKANIYNQNNNQQVSLQESSSVDHDHFLNTSNKSTRNSDIDLENIYWVKSRGHKNDNAANYNDLNAKSQKVLKEIEDLGHDILIIPINSKYEHTKDVAQSFLNTMNHKNFLSGKKKDRKRLHLRVHRI